MSVTHDDSGAAAVELALVLPFLAVLLLGIAELGFLVMLDATAAMAAREGAREMAVSQDPTAAQIAASRAFSGDAGEVPTSIDVPATCSEGTPVIVKVTFTYDTLTGLFGPKFTASGEGQMRCGG